MGEKLTNRGTRRHVLAIPVLATAALILLATPALANHTGQRTPPPTTPARTAAPNGLAALLAALLTPGRPPAGPTTPPAQAQATTTTTTTRVPTIPTLDVGASGDLVKSVEQKLDALKYFVGAVDGTYDEDTKQAVMAFQKVHSLSRTGVLNQTVYNAMQTAKDPSPLVPDGGGHRVEIDLGRQVLFLYEGGSLSKILAVSSGTSATPTPTGDYKIYYQSTGWETSALGQLYNSQYFIGGYAIHGSRSVPAEPASHGCVRLPMTAADWFPSHVRIGTPVFVR